MSDCPHCSDKVFVVKFQHTFKLEGNDVTEYVLWELPEHYSRQVGPNQWVKIKELSAPQPMLKGTNGKTTQPTKPNHAKSKG